MQEICSKLEITYNSSTNNKFSLFVIGNGIIPKIVLVEPKLGENNQTYIKFPPTYVGCRNSQRISLKNIGSIPCKAIIELYDNFSEMLILEACEDTYDLLNVCTLEGR